MYILQNFSFPFYFNFILPYINFHASVITYLFETSYAYVDMVLLKEVPCISYI